MFHLQPLETWNQLIHNSCLCIIYAMIWFLSIKWAVVAQSIGTWLGQQRVGGSSQILTSFFQAGCRCLALTSLHVCLILYSFKKKNENLYFEYLNTLISRAFTVIYVIHVQRIWDASGKKSIFWSASLLTDENAQNVFCILDITSSASCDYYYYYH